MKPAPMLLASARRTLAEAGAVLVPGAIRRLEAEIGDQIAKVPLELNEFGYDPWGFHPPTARRMLLPMALLYRYYFRVEPHDIDRAPPGRLLLVANHSGQVGYDGSMLNLAMLLEAEPPRLCRGMGEYFLFRLPWVGTAGARMGMMVGRPANCVRMLEQEQCVMVFPEGARGANKPFHQRYQLQRFGDGFMRLSLETGTPILPVGIVGAEEQQPGIANLEGVGRALGLPSLPITVTSPWLFPLGVAMALPVKYRIYFGEPLRFEGDGTEEDAVIEERVEVVKDAIRALLERGLRERKGIFR